MPVEQSFDNLVNVADKLETQEELVDWLVDSLKETTTVLATKLLGDNPEKMLIGLLGIELSLEKVRSRYRELGEKASG